MTRMILPSLAALALAACGGSEPGADTDSGMNTGAGAGADNAAQTTSTESPVTDAPSDSGAAGDDAGMIDPADAMENEAARNAADAIANDAADELANAAATGENALLAALGPAYAQADIAAGRRHFTRCQTCHTLTEGGRHMVGPNLWGVFGRTAGSVEGFASSSQLSESGVVWDADTLDQWIANPRAYIPGNRMSFVGLRNEEQRRDLIAYLAAETGYQPDAE